MESGWRDTVRAGTTYGIAGVLLGFCAFALATLARVLGGGFGFVATLGWVAGLAALVLLVWAGVAPARASGRAASGAGVGALAGACTGAGLLIGDVVDGLQSGTIPPPADAIGALGFTVNVVIILVGAAALFACLGAGLGALGGLIGRSQATQPSLYPSSYGKNQPPYPQYPGGPVGWPEYPPHATGSSTPPLPPYEAPPDPTRP